MKINPHIFREYDIRGTVDVDLSEEFAYVLGRAYAALAKEHHKQRIAVGYDCRHSSEPYAQALARGLSEEGLDVLMTGMGPTPQLYYAVYSAELGGGIQITGSHNPPDMNGFKLLLGNETLAAEAIQDLKNRALKVVGSPAPGGRKGMVTNQPVRERYINELIANCKPHMGPRKLKIVVDAGNGVGGLVGPAVLRGLGVEVIELFCDPDGNFPNHHPDPTVRENIEDLIAKVREVRADFGIGWDGDADRIGVIDEKGEPVFGDMLLLIFARAILSEVPHAKIIGDVKCSSLLFDDIRARGGEAIMWKTGHSLIKKKLKEINGELAGEMSGHIAFKHRYYGFDDALYSSGRLVEIVSKSAGQFSSLLDGLPKMVSTPEIRFECPEEIKFRVPEEIKKRFAKYKVDTLDGARIQFENGWALVRASNTQPVLVLRFEAGDQQSLDNYRKQVTQAIEEITRSLR